MLDKSWKDSSKRGGGFSKLMIRFRVWYDVARFFEVQKVDYSVVSAFIPKWATKNNFCNFAKLKDSRYFKQACKDLNSTMEGAVHPAGEGWEKRLWMKKKEREAEECQRLKTRLGMGDSSRRKAKKAKVATAQQAQGGRQNSEDGSNQAMKIFSNSSFDKIFIA